MKPRSFLLSVLLSAAATAAAGPALLTPPVEEVPWGVRVQRARQELARSPELALETVLRSADGAPAFAVLAMAHEGELEIAPELLEAVLAGTTHRAVARAAAFLLSKTAGPQSTQALVDHIAAHGPADDTAVELLLLTGARAGASVLLQRAAAASAEDPASLLAIRAVALQPAHEATVLLAGLVDDWSPAVRRVAAEALELRARAGLPTRLP